MTSDSREPAPERITPVSLLMKSLLQIALASCSLALVSANEPGFVRTYQPLGGMANGTIHIVPVMCISMYAFSDDEKSLPISFISAPYIPPSDNKAGNVNQAKEAGISFGIRHDDPKAPQIILSVESLPDDTESANKFNNTSEVVFTASLECLRLCTPPKLKNAAVVLSTKAADKGWLELLLGKYNKHNKDLPFYPTPKS
jgi:hypothetical protein